MACLTLLLAAACDPTPRVKPVNRLEGQAARIFGAGRAGLPWMSGAAVGGEMNKDRPLAFGRWRGSELDLVTAYPEMQTYRQVAGSQWHMSAYNGFPGRLSYALPLMPLDRSGSLRAVAAGRWDWVWAEVAKGLVKQGRGNAIVRVGWEANGGWYPWRTTSKSASLYRAAFTRVVRTLRRYAPDVVISFDISCGTPLAGQRTRLDGLRLLYPGDGVVDVIGCDIYDWHTTAAVSAQGWQRALRPTASPGLADVADFARARGKGLGVPEWGVAAPSEGGRGDNPFFVAKMQEFFNAQRGLLAYEAYFNDDIGKIRSSLWEPQQNPRAAARYIDLW